MIGHIFLYGPPGSGKSTLAQLLAARLNHPCLDLDAEIEITAGESITDIFSNHGEPYFRDLEAKVLERVCQNPPSIIALGGGALLRPASRELAENAGQVMLLDVPIELLLSRLLEKADSRPLLAANMAVRLPHLLAERHEHYASFPLRVEIKSTHPEEIVLELQRRLGIYSLGSMGARYEVYVRSGSTASVTKFLKELQLHGPVAIVSDDHVVPLYAGALQSALISDGYESAVIALPAGEKYKNLDSLARLWSFFLANSIERNSTVLALGGGVIGDLAGFAAAAYLRGVRWVNLPTTLLSMVDASLGGKTGIDLPEGKNLAGAFYAPALVLSDPDVLRTLPRREFFSGMAEVIKHGVINDPLLFEICEQGEPADLSRLTALVSRAVAVKAEIVEADPYESGLRQVLNYGHTIGHAVEKLSNYSLSHGEAVAIGMVAEAYISVRLGLAGAELPEKIAAGLSRHCLPTSLPAGMNIADIVTLTWLDKKRTSGVVHFALPERIGLVHTGIFVENLPALLREFSQEKYS